MSTALGTSQLSADITYGRAALAVLGVYLWVGKYILVHCSCKEQKEFVNFGKSSTKNLRRPE